jgi:hypothetical protein
MGALTYQSNQQSYDPLSLTWLDDSGNVQDLSSGWTFTLKIGREGELSPVVTKTSGITGNAVAPNLVVQWAVDDLEPLTVGDWLLQIAATQTGSNLTRYLRMPLVIAGDSDANVLASYSGDPSFSPSDQVRFLVGDTDMDEPYLLDAEIAWMISEAGSADVAAVDACVSIAAKLGQKVDGSKNVGGLSITKNFQAVRAHYLELATTLRQRAYRLHPPSIVANPNALGAEFAVGMFDIFLYDPQPLDLWPYGYDGTASADEFSVDGSVTFFEPT